MSGNRAVAYKSPGVVEVIDIDYPTFELKDGPGVNPANIGRKLPHGAILKTVSTNICGSDQHMVRGRTTAPSDLVLGHDEDAVQHVLDDVLRTEAEAGARAEPEAADDQDGHEVPRAGGLGRQGERDRGEREDDEAGDEGDDLDDSGVESEDDAHDEDDAPSAQGGPEAERD